uniref:WAT1-related protein n=1 Tax=Chenopodium quinoa TaxID=63459 RepID=A0A803N4K2_CHEQI
MESTRSLYIRAKPFLAVTLLQIGLAGMDILSKVALNRGMSNYVLVVYRHAVATIIIAPFALVLDKPVIDQNLYYMGMKYTSATFAATMGNILPAITFLMAWIMSMDMLLAHWKVPGCPFYEKGRSHVWAIGWMPILLAAVYSGVVMKERGPVFVTAFSPLGMVIVAILSTFLMAEKMYLGSGCRLLRAGGCYGAVADLRLLLLAELLAELRALLSARSAGMANRVGLWLLSCAAFRGRGGITRREGVKGKGEGGRVQCRHRGKRRGLGGADA